MQIKGTKRDSFKGVIWLDRDGTIVDDPGYLDDPEGLRLLEGGAEAVARLNAQGLAVVLVTNQSGIARGLMSRQTVDRIHEHLQEKLALGGAHLDAIYLCPHLPPELLEEGQEPCDCRKPEPGLILRARREMGLSDLPSVVVGDKLTDLELARRVGAHALLVLTGKGRKSLEILNREGHQPEHVSEDLAEGVDWIVEVLTGGSAKGGS